MFALAAVQSIDIPALGVGIRIVWVALCNSLVDVWKKATDGLNQSIKISLAKTSYLAILHVQI